MEGRKIARIRFGMSDLRSNFKGSAKSLEDLLCVACLKEVEDSQHMTKCPESESGKISDQLQVMKKRFNEGVEFSVVISVHSPYSTHT